MFSKIVYEEAFFSENATCDKLNTCDKKTN